MSIKQVYPIWQNIPGQTSIIDSDGQLQADWNEFFSNNLDNSVYYFRGDGFLMPFFPGSLISTINTNTKTGRILYDNENDLFLGNIAGVYQQFVTMTFSSTFLTKKDKYAPPKLRFHVERSLDDALFLSIGNKKYKIALEEVE